MRPHQQLSGEFAHLDYQRDRSEYLLVLQVSGHSRIEQLGRIAELEPGDMTIVDSAQPYRFKFVRKTIQLTLIIPRLRFDQVRSDWQAPSMTTCRRSCARSNST
jgi:mannose-6-phosphate isomerase-like protein (cupin superfamily)